MDASQRGEGPVEAVQPETADVDLDRDLFMRILLRDLSGTLEDVVGIDDASGFVATVGRLMGERIDEAYRDAMGKERFDREEVADVLVDLKRRIGGDFSVESIDEDRIVLRNRRCPFGDAVKGRPSLCMMTSNVFGAIASEHLGYAKVELDEAIAMGHPGCRVVVHLDRDQARESPGREYFSTGEDGT